MAINARGDQAALVGRRQADFKTGEAIGPATYVPLPFYQFSVNEAEETSQDAAMYGDAYGGDVIDGLRRVSGNLEVPLGIQSIGWHLALLLGLPTTTGAGPDYEHEFKAAATQIPLFMTGGLTHKDVAVHRKLVGLTYNGLTINANKEGARQRLAFDVLGYQETDPAATLDAAPVAWADDIVPVKFTGQVLKDTVPVADVTGVDMNLTAGQELDQEVMNNSAYADDLLSGMWGLTGNVNTRFRDRTWIDLADNATLFDLELKWTLAANQELLIRGHNLRLTKSTPSIENEGIINMSFPYAAGRPDAADTPFKVTLKNQQANYANP